MEKMKMQSENLVNENVEKIAKLFPNCVTEGKDENGQVIKLVDFDLLKQELSKVVVDGNDERYTLNWAGKKQAILTANSPINATLRPCREESVDFDNTKNLYIEGDNLDVLKLLRETYLNKIKMIYIDPPYNTGNDFVYNDDFATSSDEYLQNSKSYDEDGNRMVQNLESNGRFHSDWLSMMFPRLKLAKDLLTDDGVIFISMDDHEFANLKKICDEIFGGSNFVCNFVWEKGKEGGNDSSIMRSHYDNILCYCRNSNSSNVINLDKKDTSRHITEDKEENLVAGIESTPNEGELFQLVNLSKQKDYTVKIPLKDGTIIEWPSYAPQKSINEWIKIGKVFVGNKKVPYIKSYLKDELQGQKPSNIITQEFGTTKAGSIEIREFFGSREIFSYPKPSSLIKRLVEIGSKKDSTILDFFSGSATTAHAVMQLNAEDGGNRKFIMVQLPEKCDENSEAYKAGYKNICEIGKERIRRAGKKIIEEITNASITFGKNRKNVKEMSVEEKKIFDMAINMASEKLKNEDGLQNLENFIKQADKIIPDIGFRVLKLDSSNMKDVYYSPSDTEQTNLLDLVSNIKEDRSPEDLLFQVMLDMGVILSSEIKTLDIKGKKVFNVNDGNLVCCFDENLTDEVVTEIAKMQPLYAVFRDSSMSSDSVAVNFDQIFETYSPSTTRKVL